MGNLAEHVINGVTKIVISRSLIFSIFLVLIIAGMAQAVPEMSGTMDFPFNPKGLKSLSIKKITLAIYPESSNR